MTYPEINPNLGKKVLYKEKKIYSFREARVKAGKSVSAGAV